MNGMMKSLHDGYKLLQDTLHELKYSTERNVNKAIIGYYPIKYTPFWWWYRLVSHHGFRFDDYHVWKEFWHSLNVGWHSMNYKWEFEKFWGKGAKPEKIVLSRENFDSLMDRLHEPPDPSVVERFQEILNRKAPWDEDYEV